MTVTTVATTAPLVTLAHDWTAPVERETIYPTSVLEHQNGTEQRLSLSAVPTERLTYRLLAPSSAEAAIVHALADMADDLLIRIPRWEDQTRLDSAISAGATLIPCVTTDRETFEDGAQVILWRSAFSYEVCTIGTHTGSAIVPVSPVVAGWAAGTIVAVVEPVRLVAPYSLTHWTPTSGALSLGVERIVSDVAGLGTGGTGTAGVPAAISLTSYQIGSLGLLRTARGVLVALVTDAAGDPLFGQPVVWSSSDAANLGVVATSDPQVALATNLRPDSSLGSSVNRTITATLGALTANAVIPIRW